MYRGKRNRDVLYYKISQITTKHINPLVKRLSPIINRGRPGSFSHPICPQRWIMQGSITVEAVFAVPFLFFSLLSLCSFFQILTIQNRVQADLLNAATSYAAYGNKLSSLEALLEEHVIIQWDERESNPVCYVDYKKRVPFVGGRISLYQQVMLSSYSGRSMVPAEERETEEIVFVAKNGVVYHRDSRCTYLKLHIQTVWRKEIESLRNQSGGKYYSCSSCCGKEVHSHDTVFITAYGERYHSSKECHQLFRTVKSVPFSETGGLPACSKCGYGEK